MQGVWGISSSFVTVHVFTISHRFHKQAPEIFLSYNICIVDRLTRIPPHSALFSTPPSTYPPLLQPRNLRVPA